MQVLIPMAGAGSRFADVGYKDPKPLIDVAGRPMIRSVIENLGPDHDYIFIVQKPVLDRYANKLKEATEICKSSRFLTTHGLTEGPAQTCLLARDYLDIHQPLMIANCDQIMEWDQKHFYEWFDSTSCDGTILTFNSDSIKNSYVTTNEEGWVTDCKEKIVISNLATTGVYIWKRAVDFIWAADDMILKNIRFNNEFYVCPVYNQNILKGQEINTYHIKQHWPIGTPEDLKIYLTRNKG